MDFFDFFNKSEFSKRPWLILGKGPSFNPQKLATLTHEYDFFGLNHTVRQIRCKIVHIADLEVLQDLGSALFTNADHVVMPYYPNMDCKKLTQNITQLASFNPALKLLAKEKKLLWYQIDTPGFEPIKDKETIRARYFSAEAAVQLLAKMGVKKIRTMGIDGGNRYSGTFQDLAHNRLLANGRSSFNCQFKEIANTVFKYNINFGSYNFEMPFKVYVGATPEQMIATKVLDFSIQKQASVSAQVIPLCDVNIQVPYTKALQGRTPFSFQRFLIPKVNNYKSTAVYLDSDMQVFTDIRELFEHPQSAEIVCTKSIWQQGKRRPQFSVMLLDCEKLKWDIHDIVNLLEKGTYTYEELLFEMKLCSSIKDDLPVEWNSLEYFNPNKTKLLHYTDMTTQPWVSTRNPLAKIWCAELIEALKEQFIEYDEVKEHVNMGWIRPSLLYQIDYLVSDPGNIPLKILKLDEKYTAPYKKLQASTTSV